MIRLFGAVIGVAVFALFSPTYGETSGKGKEPPAKQEKISPNISSPDNALTGYVTTNKIVKAQKFIKHDAAISYKNISNKIIELEEFSADSKSKYALELVNCRNITIKSCRFSNASKTAISIVNCSDISIINSQIDASSDGAVFGLGVNAFKSSNITVRGCYIKNCSSGLYAQEATGVRFTGNLVVDVKGPKPRGQMVQFNQVSGRNNIISDNIAVNRKDTSDPEDVVNIFKSNGEPDSPILIENNLIYGDLRYGSEDKSKSGSGIMLGDGGGSNITARNNVVQSAGQVGIGVASGNNIVVESNFVYSPQSNRSNVGIMVWSFYKVKGGTVTVRNNTSGWDNSAGKRNPRWFGKAKFGAEYEFASVVDEANKWSSAEELKTDPRLKPRLLLPPKPEPGNVAWDPAQIVRELSF